MVGIESGVIRRLGFTEIEKIRMEVIENVTRAAKIVLTLEYHVPFFQLWRLQEVKGILRYGKMEHTVHMRWIRLEKSCSTVRQTNATLP